MHPQGGFEKLKSLKIWFEFDVVMQCRGQQLLNLNAWHYFDCEATSRCKKR